MIPQASTHTPNIRGFIQAERILPSHVPCMPITTGTRLYRVVSAPVVLWRWGVLPLPYTFMHGLSDPGLLCTDRWDVTFKPPFWLIFLCRCRGPRPPRPMALPPPQSFLPVGIGSWRHFAQVLLGPNPVDARGRSTSEVSQRPRPTPLLTSSRPWWVLPNADCDQRSRTGRYTPFVLNRDTFQHLRKRSNSCKDRRSHNLFPESINNEVNLKKTLYTLMNYKILFTFHGIADSGDDMKVILTVNNFKNY